mgnify:CR=1 FL=1
MSFLFYQKRHIHSENNYFMVRLKSKYIVIQITFNMIGTLGNNLRGIQNNYRCELKTRTKKEIVV